MSADAHTTAPSVATYRVEGLTCAHCAAAVRSEVGDLDGVSSVSVDLQPGGTSAVTVTSTAPLTRSQLAAALEEAGDYRLTGVA